MMSAMISEGYSNLMNISTAGVAEVYIYMNCPILNSNRYTNDI